MSGVRLARHYLTGMPKENWGRILFISSESALQIPTEMVHNGMKKTAQIAVARPAASVAGTGVTANGIPCWPNGVGGCGGVRRGHGEAPDKVEGGDREGILRARAAIVSAEALCHR
jgi:hypothetical protein